jgi:hypothetical protein
LAVNNQKDTVAYFLLRVVRRGSVFKVIAENNEFFVGVSLKHFDLSKDKKMTYKQRTATETPCLGNSQFSLMQTTRPSIKTRQAPQPPMPKKLLKV